jgi:protein-S-isoprenylcysteine O-methyltransferase Ste14
VSTAVARRLGDGLLAGGCLLLAVAHGAVAWREAAVGLGVLLVAEDLVLAGCFAVRRARRALAARALDVAAAALCLALPLLLGNAMPGTLAPLGLAMEVAGAVAALAATLSLGRRLGVLPAERGLAVRGPYATVRHPLYAAYVIAWAGHAVRYPSWTNLLVTLGGIALVAFRADREERLLARRAAYRLYRRSVPWRLVPGVW